MISLILAIICLESVVSSAENTHYCTCVPFYQCSDDENGVVISDGRGLLDVRQFQSENECEGHFDICCNITTSIIIEADEPPAGKLGCGQKNSQFRGKLLYKSDKQLKSKCGVSLINKKAALTAAHCLKSGEETYLVSFPSLDDDIHIDKILIHPNFNRQSLKNDISLLFLSKEIVNNQLISCIPPPGTRFDDGTPCESYTNDKIIDLPLVERDRCLNSLKSSKLGKFFKLHYSFICAGDGEHKDAQNCNGDGGNPLICPISGLPGRYHQVGIVSWGIGCGQNRLPGVYVKVSMFRDWIDDEMTKYGLDIISYRY